MSSNIEIINASWEKRNLGKDVKEIIVDKNVELNDLKNCISKLNSDLVYCKVHNLNINAIRFLEEEGFKYCENIFSLKKRLRFFQIHDVFKNALIQFYSIDINESDIEYVFSELDKGIFETDRISLAPEFGPKISNNRYKNWLSDMYNSSGEYQLKIIKNKDHEPIGFYTLKISDKIAYAPLGGLFSNYKMSGLGHSIIYFSLLDAINFNCKILKTQISSNNMPIFSIYSSVFGFEITKNHVVMTKVM